MLKAYVVLLFLTIPAIAISQSLLFGGGDPNRGSGLIEVSPVVINENYEGTPYVTDEYSVIKLNKIEEQTFKARYNAVKDAMEVLADDGVAYNLIRDINLDIIFLATDANYRVFYYKNQNNSNRSGFFVVLNDDDIKLLKKESIKFHDEILAKTSYDRSSPAKFKRESDTFYFQINGSFVKEIPKKGKDFVKQLNLDSNMRSNVLSYIKKNGLKLNDEENLITLFNYINLL